MTSFINIQQGQSFRWNGGVFTKVLRDLAVHEASTKRWRFTPTDKVQPLHPKKER